MATDYFTTLRAADEAAHETPEQRYVRLDAERKEHEARAEELRKECYELQKRILDFWADNEIDKMNVRGKTLYPRRLVVPQIKTTQDDLCAALQGTDLEGLARYSVNMNTLRAEIRRITEAGDPIPAVLLDHIDLIETRQLIVRSGK